MAHVESGLYESASEVVREGRRLLRHREELQQTQVERVRARLEQGWQQSERGQMVSGGAARGHFQRRLAARRTRA